MSHARPADPQEYARLHNLVEGLCIAAGLPKPRLYIIDDAAPNAFATGRNPHHAAVAVTTGLLEKMNRVELEGVLAHELSHVKNYDILVSTLAVTLVGVIAILATSRSGSCGGAGRATATTASNGAVGRRRSSRSSGSCCWSLMPVVARLMQFAVSRRRESLADFTGVALTRYPPGLIAALEKLKDDTTVVTLLLTGNCSSLDRAAHCRKPRKRAASRGSTGCSTPTHPSTSASPHSGSSEFKMNWRHV